MNHHAVFGPSGELHLTVNHRYGKMVQMARIEHVLRTAGPAEQITSQYSELAVVAIIEERIKGGVYAPGSRDSAERTLASELGVSRRFVRMAYSRLIEQGLLEKSHYRRPFVVFSSGASSLGHVQALSNEFAATSSRTIAAVVPSHPTFPGGLSIVAGIHKVLADVGSPFRLKFLDTFHSERPEVLRREAQAIRTALDEGVAGLIWWCYSEEETVLDIIRANPRTAIVFIDRYPNNIHCDFAGIDDVESSRAAVEYLIDQGHTRIAHLMDPGNYSTILERAEGYRTAHLARGLPAAQELIYHLDWDEHRMERAFDHLYSLQEPPTALFTSNDFIAYEFIKMAESRGYRVPDDLSVVGHGNIDKIRPPRDVDVRRPAFRDVWQGGGKALAQTARASRRAAWDVPARDPSSAIGGKILYTKAAFHRRRRIDKPRHAEWARPNTQWRLGGCIRRTIEDFHSNWLARECLERSTQDVAKTTFRCTHCRRRIRSCCVECAHRLYLQLMA